MAEYVDKAAEAVRTLATAMRDAGVAQAEFRDGPVSSLRLGPALQRAPLTEPAPPFEEALSPEDAARKAQKEYDDILYASSGA